MNKNFQMLFDGKNNKNEIIKKGYKIHLFVKPYQ